MSLFGIPRHWQKLVLRLAIVYLLAALLGLLTGKTIFIMALISTMLLGWSLWNTYQLDQWARGNRVRGLPTSKGIWSEIFVALAQRWRSRRERIATLVDIVHEVRQANRALPDGIVATDGNNVVRWSNSSADRLLGLKGGKDKGQPVTNLVRFPEFRPWIESGSQGTHPLVISSPFREQMYLQIQVIGYGQDRRLFIVRDITELYLAESTKKEFVANVSHELRTPLTVIYGYLETLAEDVPDQWKPAFSTMIDQSARMRVLVDDLLTLSRLDASAALENEARIAMNELLQNILNEANIISDGRHRIRLDVDSDIEVIGDPKDIHSAFMNLVSNAIRYTPDDGRIIITWREAKDGWLEFSVSDNGPGIGAEHLTRLTERFYRVSKDRSRDSGGTGLGLAIVKHVMFLHGGLLAVHSEPGEGSHFTCRLPPERKPRSLSAAS